MGCNIQSNMGCNNLVCQSVNVTSRNAKMSPDNEKKKKMKPKGKVRLGENAYKVFKYQT